MVELTDLEEIVETRPQEGMMPGAELDEVVAEATRKAEEEEHDPTAPITLSSGVVVKAKTLPEIYSFSLRREFPQPRPPKVKIVNEEDGKDWWEENPNDPNYEKELERWQEQISLAAVDLTLLKGFDIISSPKEMLSFEKDKEFVEDQELFGIVMKGRSRRARYLMWLRYRVVLTMDDLRRIETSCNALSDISQEAIAEAEARFRGES